MSLCPLAVSESATFPAAFAAAGAVLVESVLAGAAAAAAAGLPGALSHRQRGVEWQTEQLVSG